LTKITEMVSQGVLSKELGGEMIKKIIAEMGIPVVNVVAKSIPPASKTTINGEAFPDESFMTEPPTDADDFFGA
jgi:hypothetical protein